MEAWPTWKTTPELPKLGLTSFLSLSRTQKTVGPKILKIWDSLVSTVHCPLVSAVHQTIMNSELRRYEFVWLLKTGLPRMARILVGKEPFIYDTKILKEGFQHYTP